MDQNQNVANATTGQAGAQEAASAAPATKPAVKEISVSFILGRLAEGKSREEIREELGLKKSEFSRVMKHPQLKGKKGKSTPRTDRFVVVDDITPTQATAPAVGTTDLGNAGNAGAPGAQPAYGYIPDTPNP